MLTKIGQGEALSVFEQGMFFAARSRQVGQSDREWADIAIDFALDSTVYTIATRNGVQPADWKALELEILILAEDLISKYAL